MRNDRVKRYAAGKACLIMLSAVVLLTACMSGQNERDIDLSLYTDDMDLQAEKIRIQT